MLGSTSRQGAPVPAERPVRAQRLPARAWGWEGSICTRKCPHNQQHDEDALPLPPRPSQCLWALWRRVLITNHMQARKAHAAAMRVSSYVRWASSSDSVRIAACERGGRGGTAGPPWCETSCDNRNGVDDREMRLSALVAPWFPCCNVDTLVHLSITTHASQWNIRVLRG